MTAIGVRLCQIVVITIVFCSLMDYKDTKFYCVSKIKFLFSLKGAGGTVQFPKNFVKRAYDAVKSRGGLCIADEVRIL